MAKRPDQQSNHLPAQGDTAIRLEHALKDLALLATPAQRQTLLHYLQQLLHWNKTYNLTAIRNLDHALTHHLFDSLSVVAPILNAHDRLKATPLRIMDVGSGGGLPGIILAIMLPTAEITCLDAVEKKTTFIRQMVSVLSLQNLQVMHARVEAIEPQNNTIVISRAFASLQEFAQLASHHVVATGYLLAMKGKPPTDEILALNAETLWQTHTVESLTVPELDAQRCLVWMQRKGIE